MLQPGQTKTQTHMSKHAKNACNCTTCGPRATAPETTLRCVLCRSCSTCQLSVFSLRHLCCVLQHFSTTALLEATPDVAVCAQELGHNWIDVMKIDVEGSEYDVFQQVAQSKTPMPFTQMQIEVHHMWVDTPNRKILQLLHQLMSSGMRVFSLEPNIYFAGNTCMEFALMRVDACGNVVTPTTAQA